MTQHIGFQHDDGGRGEAGFKPGAGDCVCRAVTIAGQMDYREVYDLFYLTSAKIEREPSSPRDGVSRKVIDAVLVGEWGWTWTPTMQIGSGTRVHLRADELPGGRIVARLSRHTCAVIDGVVRDTYDQRREGTRAVYGFWTVPDGWSPRRHTDGS